MYRSNSNYEGNKLNLGIEEGNVQSVYIFFYYPFDLSGKFHRRDPKSDPRPSK